MTISQHGPSSIIEAANFFHRKESVVEFNCMRQQGFRAMIDLDFQIE
jgi:hypothetical protein